MKLTTEKAIVIVEVDCRGRLAGAKVEKRVMHHPFTNYEDDRDDDAAN